MGVIYKELKKKLFYHGIKFRTKMTIFLPDIRKKKNLNHKFIIKFETIRFLFQKFGKVIILFYVKH